MVLREHKGKKQAATPSLPLLSAQVISTTCTPREILHAAQHIFSGKWPPTNLKWDRVMSEDVYGFLDGDCAVGMPL